MELKRIIIAGIRVVCTNVRFLFGKVVHGRNLSYSPVTAIALTDSVMLSNNAKLIIGKRFRTRGHCCFNVSENGLLRFGENVFINSGCQFNCRKQIDVGSGCEFGQNVLLYDHDHEFRSCEGLKANEFKCESIAIGENCWIGSGTIILRGTEVGSNSVIGAGCILKEKIPENSLVLQKRDTTIVTIKERYAIK